MSTAVERLQEKYEKDLKLAVTEDGLNAFFKQHPLDVQNGVSRRLFVHHKPLYSNIATIKYGDEFSRNLVSWTSAVELMTLYPAEPLTRVRGSTLSFQPTEHVEGLPDEARERKDEMEIVPLILHIDGAANNYTITELQWSTKTPLGLARVEVYVASRDEIVFARAEKRIVQGEVHYDRPHVSLGQFLQQKDLSSSQLLSTICWSGAPFSRAPISLCWGYPDPKVDGENYALDLLIHLATLATSTEIRRPAR